MRRWRHHYLPAALLALLLGAAGPTRALRSDAKQPVNIRARSVEANEATGIATYTGDVVLSQGTLRLDADRLEVQLRDGKPYRVRAWGKPLQLRTRTDNGENLHASAGRTEYYVQERRISLYDNAVLTRDSDTVTGGMIRYFFDTQQLSAEGGDQGVSVVIHPAAPEEKP